MKTAAIAIPVYREKLTADEEISFRQLRHFLSAYDIYFVAPEGLRVPDKNIPVKFFDKKYFTGLGSYSQLLISPKFYQEFQEYQYVLVYQLDALVFSDRLLEWCEKGYDYIGAPWLAGALPPNDPRGNAVGNGGFSLRKVSSFLKTLENYKYSRSVFSGLADAGRVLIERWKYLSFKQWINAFRWKFFMVPIFGHILVEDYFWSFEAKRHNPDFNIAPVSEALRFAFENNPSYCFGQNHHELPFGCHAWPKYDRKFWEQHLLK